MAISWQPGFCETRPRLPECRSQKESRFDATHFALHGLWPQPRSQSYCGVSESEKQKDISRQWSRLRGLGLSEDLQKRLLEIMPGARSFLHRHEWIKHGTCYGDDPGVYYEDSLALMRQINASKLQDLFASSIGKRLTGRQIRRVVDAEFGSGAGKRVRIACKRDGRRTIITELTIGLSGRISEDSDLPDLILAARPTRPGCPEGIVDAVGLQ
ncbi:MAG: hypothetical protein ABJM29_12290 [Rhizobiaceae bacterium]